MRPANTTSHRPGTATYPKGQDAIGRILDTAFQLAIDEGFEKVTVRRIARELGISPGNLSYYYASRSDLLGALLDRVIEGYIAEFDRLRAERKHSPEDQLRAVLRYVLDDLSTPETTLFFPELWQLANRDPKTSAQMERMYGAYLGTLEAIISLLCADPDPQTHKDLALVLCGNTEGQTIFIGHERPHRARASQIKSLVVEQSIALVKSAAKNARSLQN